MNYDNRNFFSGKCVVNANNLYYLTMSEAVPSYQFQAT